MIKIYNKEKIIEAISKMSISDISELILMIEKKFNITKTKTKSKNNSNNIKEEKKEKFNVILKEIGNNKILTIKAIRSITNLGLKESKELVEKAPIEIKKNINKNELEKIKEIMQNTGAIIEIK